MSIIRVQASVLKPLVKGFGCSARYILSQRGCTPSLALLKSSDMTGDFCSQSRQPSPRSTARRGVSQEGLQGTDQELTGGREARTQRGSGRITAVVSDADPRSTARTRAHTHASLRAGLSHIQR